MNYNSFFVLLFSNVISLTEEIKFTGVNLHRGHKQPKSKDVPCKKDKDYIIVES